MASISIGIIFCAIISAMEKFLSLQVGLFNGSWSMDKVASVSYQRGGE